MSFDRFSEAAEPVRIALLQTEVATGDPAADLETLRVAAKEAADGGAQLLLTPEMFVTGYNLPDRVAQLAAEPLLDQLREIARTAGIALAAGLPFETHAGITNSAVLIDASGEVLLHYDKTHLFGDLDRSMFVQGSDASATALWKGLRVGFLICYDVEFPETVRALAQDGVDVVLVPTAQMEPFSFIAETVIPTRAWENQVYLAYANLIGSEDELTYVGRSSITAPTGEVTTFNNPLDGGLLFTDINPALLERSRAANPYLADRRTDLYAPANSTDSNDAAPSAP